MIIQLDSSDLRLTIVYMKEEIILLKIFSTQLTGYFQKMITEEELNIEEGARILAQTIMNEGTIYIKGFREMSSIELEATQGEEPLPHAHLLDTEEIHPIDCVLLASRFSTDEEAVALAKKLQEKGIPLIGISTQKKEAEDSLQEYADVHIDTKLIRKLLPADDGSRFGYPSIMTGLFAYYGLVFTMKEILEDY